MKNKKVRRKKRRQVRDSHFEDTRCVLSDLREEEDWEQECEANLEQRFSVQPYGPEDVFMSAFQDLTLEQGIDMPYTASYNPAEHHPRPLLLDFTSIATEPEQFADADE
ncbi:uncharacterized protein LOC144055340 isoform X2 [Vanacampus margaritifer]